MKRLFTWTGWTKEDWIMNFKLFIGLIFIAVLIIVGHGLPYWLFP